MKRPSIHWFRSDLRLADNPALDAAVREGGPVVPVFVWAPDEEGSWAPGSASRWWLHQSLEALNADLRALGSRLILRRGPSLPALIQLARETGARALFWNRRYEPAVAARDAQIRDELQRSGLNVEMFNAALLHEPEAIRNQSGKPFQVFTPFWKRCLAEPDPPEPTSRIERLSAPAAWPASLRLDAFDLEPSPDWAGGLRDAWQPGEAGAQANLRHFLSSAFAEYAEQRNRPDVRGTSRLSPHLHFGEIGPRQVWHDLERMAAGRRLPVATWRGSAFLAEVGWREFSHHLLWHFPHTPEEPLRPAFAKFPWRTEPAFLEAWRRGRTGYPIVDAGMRELWATGWMHNRVRMIAASFLVKDLLLPWIEGARWFWDTLVDADLAQNTLGWQWVAGCGADAAPYFRIFNPVSQGQKFDPHGDYVRRWCPELAELPTQWIHRPHEAPTEVLRAAGIEIGRAYPEPIVSHAIAREVALEAYGRISATKGN
ncbi:MAG TPA: deoxyribodipyrimidine photo-lyase [Candidatus Paceibacterota bacterium]|nr:deoxyribodipyrimidine photo-lyase [Candidatus Paceibacterota bacterium]